MLAALCFAQAAYAAPPMPALPLDQLQTPLGLAVKNYLQSQVQQNGSVRLIVTLKASAQPEHALNFNQILTQRKSLFAVQDAFLKRLAKFGGVGHKQFDTLPFVVVEAGNSALAHLLSQSPDVLSIQEDALLKPSLAQSVPLILADNAWTAGATGAGQVVAIIDSGVDSSHPFLAGKVVAEACYSTSSFSAKSVCPNGSTSQTGAGAGKNCSIAGCEHGTHVAGIAAGAGPNFSGVAKDAKIIAVQVFSSLYSGCASPPCLSAYTSDIIKGLEYVYSQRSNFSIAAVNMSLGGGAYTSNCDSDAMKRPIDNLRAVGIASIVSSGNESKTNSLSSPACISSAISVGATTKSDVVASYSNSANFLTLLAPGSGINSSVPGGGFAAFNGTSMATPHVTGTWAALKSKKTTATVTDIRDALVGTGVSITDSRNSIVKPRIQVQAALNRLLTPILGTSTSTSSSTSSSTTTSTTTTTTLAATCYTSSNYSHVLAGRAYSSFGYAYAKGSNQKMGFNNTFYSTTLKKTGTNYYVIGTCP
ncbi:MAG: S8 family serine peptidase [Burkholderiales bacterium]|nr:S8 family serine peptidase [Burkholderiales bacterium]